MIDRDTERDVHDTANIIKKYSPPIKDISSLFDKKQEVKISKYPKVNNLVTGFSGLVSQKKNWSTQELNLRHIYSYLNKI
jgi:hypothetical protein